MEILFYLILCLFTNYSFVTASKHAKGYEAIYYYTLYKIDFNTNAVADMTIARKCRGAGSSDDAIKMCNFNEFLRHIARSEHLSDLVADPEGNTYTPDKSLGKPGKLESWGYDEYYNGRALHKDYEETNANTNIKHNAMLDSLTESMRANWKKNGNIDAELRLARECIELTHVHRIADCGKDLVTFLRSRTHPLTTYEKTVVVEYDGREYVQPDVDRSIQESPDAKQRSIDGYKKMVSDSAWRAEPDIKRHKPMIDAAKRAFDLLSGPRPC
jgi:hypothetical protein